MKKGYELFEPVIVYWNDAWTDAGSSFLIEQAQEYGITDLQCKTIGFLLELNDDCVVLAESLSKAEPSLKCKIISNIPIAMVEKIERLQPVVKKRKKRARKKT